MPEGAEPLGGVRVAGLNDGPGCGQHGAASAFLGRVLSHFAGAALSLLVDALWFPGRGHGL